MSGKTPKDVTLVGYRKTVASPNVHSRVIENSTQLGTLSPASSTELSSNLRNMSSSVSLPLIERSDWSRNSDGTLPEYMQVARRSLRQKKRHKHQKLITVDFGGSDPDVSTEKEGEEEVPRRLKRAFTDPARHSAKLSDDLKLTNVGTKQSDHGSKIIADTDADSAKDESIVSETSLNKASDSVSAASSGLLQEDDSSSVKKQLNFQEELHRNLSDCLTKTLGGMELHDSDKSDDETCVQNGFDEYLEGDNGQPSESEDTVHSTTSKSLEQTEMKMEEEIDSHIQHSGNLTVRDILKNNMLQLTSSGDQKSENGNAHINGSQSALGNGNKTKSSSGEMDAKKDFEQMINWKGGSPSSSRSIMVMPKREQSILSESSASTRDSGIVVTGSQLDIASKAGSTVEIVTDSERRYGPEHVTVIELLKEEYKRNSVVIGTELNQSLSEFSVTRVSGMPVKTHKASSDSNILQSVEVYSRIPGNNLDVKKPNDVMSTSASFPELSKLSLPAMNSPKLVNKVGHKTVK